MKKIGYLLLNILLAIAIILFISAFIATIFTSAKQHAFILDILPLCLIVFGAVVVYLVSATKSAYQLFIGLTLIFSGIFLFLIMRSILASPMSCWWPIFGIISAINLLISGIYKYKKLSFGFVIPTLTLIILSAWFFLFSFKIITIPFKTVVIIGGPLLVVMLCVFLFILFFLQQKGMILVEHNEESKQFEDDEIIPN